MKTIAIYADFSQLTQEKLDFLESAVLPHQKNKECKLRAESVCARAVLKYMLDKYYGVTEYFIDTAEKGKPYLINSELHFNFSHSIKRVICAVSDAQVGCDVQDIRPFNEKVTKRFFSSAEDVALSASAKRDEHFIKLWALKEAILKYNGDGISGGLAGCSFAEYLSCEEFSAYGLYFKSFKKDGFCYGICSETDNISVFEIDIKDILKNLT